MQVAEAVALVEAVGGVEPSCRDRDALAAAVASSARLRAWLDARELRLAAQLADVTARPDQVIAAAARTSVRDAGRVLERVRTTETIPALGGALAAGTVSGAHVDVVTTALRQLEPPRRQDLVAEGDWLVGLAEQSTPDELRRALAAEVRRLEADGGMARLERQRRATRLRHWVDGEGLWCLSGRFDPETGLVLHRRLSAAAESLFAERVPDHAPSDPLERQSFLRAHALVALSAGGCGPGGGATRGQGEVIVVLDTRAPDGSGPVVDWGLPVELPTEVLVELFGAADASVVVVRDGVVLHAPGHTELGRSTRLANRAQRRVLRALYPTCAIPGCDVRYELCKVHHVVWWEHGGATDVDNLLPVCVRHHHDIHDHGWQLTLRAGRELTIDYPDGTRQVTRPPPRGP